MAFESADPDWFRPPSRREHAIAAALFVGFGLFFAALFIVQAGWWFRWAILGFAIISTVVGLGHLRDWLRAYREMTNEQTRITNE